MAISKAEYGSDVIVEAIRNLGAEYIMINPGASFRGVHDSLVNYLGNTKPELILCNHEEIAVAIAHGYARATGKPAFAFVHDIVGLLHASMAMFNAWMAREAVIVLGGTGPVDANHRRPWIDWIHTANVQGNAVRDMVKWDDQPASAEASVESLIRAYHVANTEPKGPVYVCFDTDVQEGKLDEPFDMPDFARFPAPTRFQPDPQAIDEVAGMLVNAKNPAFIAEFLGRDETATTSLVRLAESLNVPVIAGTDLFNFPTNHPLNASDSKNDILSEADVVVAFDVYDLQQVLTRQNWDTRTNEDILKPETKLIDVSLRQLTVKSWADDHGALYPTEMQLMADTGLAIPALADAVQRRLDDGAGNRSEIDARGSTIKDMHDANVARNRQVAVDKADEYPLHLATVSQALYDVVKNDDWVIGNGNYRGWVQKLFDFTSPHQDMAARGGGGLGQGLPHAVGVALANRDKGRLTINIQSDGDMLFTESALWTAVHHKIPMLIIMYNNKNYGNDLGHQASVARTRSRPEENKVVGIEITDPDVDFVGLARSFGCYAEGPIEKAEDLKAAFERARKEVVENGRVALVDVYTQVV